MRAGGGSITAPIEYAEAYIYVEDNKVDMVPASRRDGQCAIVFADPPVGKHHRRAATPLPRDLNPGQRVISKRAKPLHNPGPRAEVTRVTSSQERVTKVISTRARVANTATNKGSSVVADPPDRELPLAVRCTPLSQWEGTCNSQWLA